MVRAPDGHPRPWGRLAAARPRLRNRRVDPGVARRPHRKPRSRRSTASAEMLAEAKRKTWPPGVRFVQGNVEGARPGLGFTGLYDGNSRRVPAAESEGAHTRPPDVFTPCSSRARRWRCTSTRSPIPCAASWSGARSAGGVIIPMGKLARGIGRPLPLPLAQRLELRRLWRRSPRGCTLSGSSTSRSRPSPGGSNTSSTRSSAAARPEPTTPALGLKPHQDRPTTGAI